MILTCFWPFNTRFSWDSEFHVCFGRGIATYTGEASWGSLNSGNAQNGWSLPLKCVSCNCSYVPGGKHCKPLGRPTHQPFRRSPQELLRCHRRDARPRLFAVRLSPYDYGKDALYEKTTRALMEKITPLGCACAGMFVLLVRFEKSSHPNGTSRVSYVLGVQPCFICCRGSLCAFCMCARAVCILNFPLLLRHVRDGGGPFPMACSVRQEGTGSGRPTFCLGIKVRKQSNSGEKQASKG